jgi:hypothetical protein
MQNYEGRGTPVDIDVKNMLSDVIYKEDRVLLKAIDLLKL